MGWKPLRKGALRGFASIRIGRALIVHDCPVLAGINGRCWATLPRRPVLDGESRHRRDDRGKPVYSQIAEWSERDMRERFSDAVVAAVQREHADDLDGDGP
jgi:DNA-binding cell septation regulator SpoVG